MFDGRLNKGPLVERGLIEYRTACGQCHISLLQESSTAEMAPKRCCRRGGNNVLQSSQVRANVVVPLEVAEGPDRQRRVESEDAGSCQQKSTSSVSALIALSQPPTEPV